MAVSDSNSPREAVGFRVIYPHQFLSKSEKEIVYKITLCSENNNDINFWANSKLFYFQYEVDSLLAHPAAGKLMVLHEITSSVVGMLWICRALSQRKMLQQEWISPKGEVVGIGLEISAVISHHVANEPFSRIPKALLSFTTLKYLRQRRNIRLLFIGWFSTAEVRSFLLYRSTGLRNRLL